MVAAAIFFGRADTLYRTLLGRGGGLPQPAFRDLLPPGHRILHRARARSASSPARRASTRWRAASSPPSPGRRTRSPIASFRAAIARLPRRGRRGGGRLRRRGAGARALPRAPRAGTAAVRTIAWLSPQRSARVLSRRSSRRCDEPAGLLAAGGDLSPERLLAAYRRGIFPWYSPGQPVLWWSPDPREVLFPQEFHCLAQPGEDAAQRGTSTCPSTADFDGVDRRPARRRARSSPGTWITPEMHAAYLELHRLGHRAQRRDLARRARWSAVCTACGSGGVFFGESMFSRERDASKVALAHLVALCRRKRHRADRLPDALARTCAASAARHSARPVPGAAAEHVALAPGARSPRSDAARLAAAAKLQEQRALCRIRAP